MRIHSNVGRTSNSSDEHTRPPEMDWRTLSALDPSNIDFTNASSADRDVQQLARMISGCDLQHDFFTDKVDPNLLKTFSIAQRLLQHFLTLSTCTNPQNRSDKNESGLDQAATSKLILLQTENRRLRRLLLLHQNSRQLLQQIEPETNGDPNQTTAPPSLRVLECEQCGKCFQTQLSLRTHRSLRHSDDPGEDEEGGTKDDDGDRVRPPHRVPNGPLMQQIQAYGNAMLIESKPLRQLTDQVQRLRDELDQTRQRLEEEQKARQKLQSVIQQEVRDKLTTLQATWMTTAVEEDTNDDDDDNNLDEPAKVKLSPSHEERKQRQCENDSLIHNENDHERTRTRTLQDDPSDRMTKLVGQIDRSADISDRLIKPDIESQTGETMNENVDRSPRFNSQTSVQFKKDHHDHNDDDVYKEPSDERIDEIALFTGQPSTRYNVSNDKQIDSRSNEKSPEVEVDGTPSRSNSRQSEDDDGRRMEEIVMRQGEIVQKLAQDVQLLVTALNSNLSSGTGQTTLEGGRSEANRSKVNFLDRLAQIEMETRLRKEAKKRKAEQESERRTREKEAKKREKEARKMLLKLKSMPLTSASLEQLANEMEQNRTDSKGRPKDSMSSVDLRSLSLHQFSSRAQEEPSMIMSESHESKGDTSNPPSESSTNGHKIKWSKMFRPWNPKFKRSKSSSNLNGSVIDQQTELCKQEEEEIANANDETSLAKFKSTGEQAQSLDATIVNSTVSEESNHKLDTVYTNQEGVALTDQQLNDVGQEVRIDSKTSLKTMLSSKSIPIPSIDSVVRPAEYEPPNEALIRENQSTLSDSSASTIRHHQRTPSPIDLNDSMTETRFDPLDQYLQIQKNRIRKPPRRSKLVVNQLPTISQLDERAESTIEHRPVILKGVLKKNLAALDVESNERKTKRISFNEQTTQIHLPGTEGLDHESSDDDLNNSISDQQKSTNEQVLDWKSATILCQESPAQTSDFKTSNANKPNELTKST